MSFAMKSLVLLLACTAIATALDQDAEIPRSDEKLDQNPQDPQRFLHHLAKRHAHAPEERSAPMKALLETGKLLQTVAMLPAETLQVLRAITVPLLNTTLALPANLLEGAASMSLGKQLQVQGHARASSSDLWKYLAPWKLIPRHHLLLRKDFSLGPLSFKKVLEFGTVKDAPATPAPEVYAPETTPLPAVAVPETAPAPVPVVPEPTPAPAVVVPATEAPAPPVVVAETTPPPPVAVVPVTPIPVVVVAPQPPHESTNQIAVVENSPGAVVVENANEVHSSPVVVVPAAGAPPPPVVVAETTPLPPVAVIPATTPPPVAVVPVVPKPVVVVAPQPPNESTNQIAVVENSPGALVVENANEVHPSPVVVVPAAGAPPPPVVVAETTPAPPILEVTPAVPIAVIPVTTPPPVPIVPVAPKPTVIVAPQPPNESTNQIAVVQNSPGAVVVEDANQIHPPSVVVVPATGATAKPVIVEEAAPPSPVVVIPVTSPPPVAAAPVAANPVVVVAPKPAKESITNQIAVVQNGRGAVLTAVSSVPEPTPAPVVVVAAPVAPPTPVVVAGTVPLPPVPVVPLTTPPPAPVIPLTTPPPLAVVPVAPSPVVVVAPKPPIESTNQIAVVQHSPGPVAAAAGISKDPANTI